LTRHAVSELRHALTRHTIRELRHTLASHTVSELRHTLTRHTIRELRRTLAGHAVRKLRRSLTGDAVSHRQTGIQNYESNERDRNELTHYKILPGPINLLIEPGEPFGLGSPATATECRDRHHIRRLNQVEKR
jgi:hypothetical protein